MPAPFYDSPHPLKDNNSAGRSALVRSYTSPLLGSSTTTATGDSTTTTATGDSTTTTVPQSRSSLLSDTALYSLPPPAKRTLSSSSSSPSLSLRSYETKATTSTSPIKEEPRWHPFPRPWKYHPLGPLHTFTLHDSDTSYDYPGDGVNVHNFPAQLPPYISPADSPIERPSTPHSARDTHLEDRDRIATAHSLLGKTVNWPTQFRSNGVGNRHERFTDRSTNHDIPGEGDAVAAGCGQVDCDVMDVPESISAVMASESSSRSRKGTQLLGLFKENNKAIEERGRERQRREEKERAKEKERFEKRRNREDEKAKETVAKGIIGDVAANPLQSAPAEKNKENALCSDSVPVSRTKDDRNPPSSRDVTSLEAVPGDDSSRSVASTVSRPSSSPFLLPVPSTTADSLDAVDGRLKSIQTSCEGLADSGYHEGDDGCSRSPESQIESRASSYTSTVVDSRPSRKADVEGDEGLDHTVRDRDHCMPDHTASDHDEEEGEDEISSAVYFPHTTPSLARTPSASTIPSTRSQEASSDRPFQRHTGIVEGDNRPRIYSQHAANSSEVDLSIRNEDDEVLYHRDGEKRRRASVSEDDNPNYTSAASSVVSGFSDNSDYYESSTDDIERSVVEDSDVGVVTPTSRKTFPVPRAKDRHGCDSANNKLANAPPLGAVELKPYKHQVGGHTALFRFSKKAVCKSLSNRENEFYEAIETRHPELLKFLPRYIIHIPQTLLPCLQC